MENRSVSMEIKVSFLDMKILYQITQSVLEIFPWPIIPVTQEVYSVYDFLHKQLEMSNETIGQIVSLSSSDHEYRYNSGSSVSFRARLTIWQKGLLPTGPSLLGAPRFTQF
jgi:hypothetical protein